MADFRLTADDAGQPAGLIARAKLGDLDAFDQIMRLHQKQVLMTALRILGNMEDAQDAAQETFLRLYKSLNRLPDVLEMKGWLYRVTVNICNDVHRQRGRRKTEPLTGPEPVSSHADPEKAWNEVEREQLVEIALKTLPEKERAAVVLRDVQGLSTREVAEILGSSEVTVRSQISVARGKLKRFTDRYLRKHL
ncbi:MAG TPA: RNA polymerase sigma factor [Bryobacteraceae bacterium]